VDFLELSFPGQIHAEWDKRLRELKELARSADEREQSQAQVVIGGKVFAVLDMGVGYFPFLLRSNEFLIKLSGVKAKSLPFAFVQVRSEYLGHVGPIGAVESVRALLSEVGQIEGPEMVSRIDLAVDVWSEFDMEGWDRRSWVTHAEYRQSHSIGDRFSGWSIGLKGPVAFRLYDKTLEIDKQSKKY
jgi:hypothetical protein